MNAAAIRDASRREWNRIWAASWAAFCVGVLWILWGAQ